MAGQLKKMLAERMLAAELTHHLANEDATSKNHRNGTTPKKVLAPGGELQLDIPRDRLSSFEPQLVAKGQRRMPGFDDHVISMYARGMSVREIQGHLLELYGTEVSPMLISTITDEVIEEVTQWQQRPLETMYPIVYFDALRLKIRDEGTVKNKAVYLALGIRADGRKEVLGLWIEQTEGAKFWLKVFNELKNRGLDDILIAVVDGLRGFPEAIEAVYGFRPKRSTADAGEQCFKSLAHKASAQWVLEADIKSCFDEISHEWMLANIPTDTTIFRKWLKAGYVYQNELFPTNAGTPQGGIISPVAMNMTLDGLEARLAEKFPKAKRTGLKMNMVRYADDFIITGHSKEWLEDEVKPVLVEFLAERGMVLSVEKTKVTHIGDGFDFLGWNFRKYHGKLLMKPSKANIKAHLDKIREVIKVNKTAKQARLITLLNPILRGWANYHSHVVAKKTFARVDHEVWSTLWRWAVRRHPNKGSRWVKEKYFKSQGARNWVFSAIEKKEDGTKKERILLLESDTPIVRHIKIKAGANPHDPRWEPYFEDRWVKAMLKSGRGRSKLYRVWLSQDRNCPECNQPITKSTPWAFRHIVKRADGGADAAGNLQMHHLNCHRQQHAEKEVV